MRDLGELIVAKGFKKLPKVQLIAQSGYTDQASKSILRNVFHDLPAQSSNQGRMNCMYLGI